MFVEKGIFIYGVKDLQEDKVFFYLWYEKNRLKISPKKMRIKEDENRTLYNNEKQFFNITRHTRGKYKLIDNIENFIEVKDEFINAFDRLNERCLKSGFYDTAEYLILMDALRKNILNKLNELDNKIKDTEDRYERVLKEEEKEEEPKTIVECIDNTGIEELFDKGMTYLLHLNNKDNNNNLIQVETKFGDKQYFLANRFKIIEKDKD